MSEGNGLSTPNLYMLARASTLKQAPSVAAQLEQMEAARKILSLPEGTPLEEPLATSGKTRFCMRPIGGFLMRTLKKGDCLMVTKLDRLGRNLLDVYETVNALFQRGVNIIILHGWGNQMVDMRNATHRIMLLLLAWFAEYERELIATRTREGLEYRRNAGLATSHKSFHRIQCYKPDGTPIPRGEFNRVRGDFRKYVPDSTWLDQVVQLLALQKAIGAKGQELYDYCKERDFRDGQGNQWWDEPPRWNGKGFFRNKISKALLEARRMAVKGTLPEDYCRRILAITGDTPLDVLPKWKLKVPRKRASGQVVEDRSQWSLEQWQAEWLEQQAAMEQ